MSNELSRRKFLERIGWGTAAGASLSLLKEVAAARPAVAGPLPSRTLGRTGATVCFWHSDAVAASLCTTTKTRRWRR